jgi:ankyrin repeat protein
MSRSLSSKSTPDVLKQDAKRWLKQLRAADPDARARLTAAWPAAPADPSLRDVQHALAREYGFVDWKGLLAALDDLALDRQSRAERLDGVLRHGWGGDRVRARRLLARDPSLAHENIFAAASCGDVETVRALLAGDATLATKPGGPHTWPPLAYVCYGRLDAEHAVTIATLLLDAGADPNFAFNDGWDNAFTCVTGCIGRGEGAPPTHPQADALVALLLERGADPYDTQALYNDSIVDDSPHWLEVLWQACDRAGRTAEWSAIDGRSIGGRIKVGTLNYLLGNAVTNRHLRRATWLLAHGADPRTRHSYQMQPVHTVARLAGYTELTALLEAHGAQPEPLAGPHALVAALMNGDDPAAQALLAADPSLVKQPLLPLVAGLGNTRAVAMLLDAGADIDGRDGEGATALHRAAHANAVPVLDLLLARGAQVDLRDPRWHGTPFGWSVATGRAFAAERLASVTRDARALVRSGRVERLRALLHESPALARERQRDDGEPTLLFALPDDESVAGELVELLLAHGVDRTVRNAQGHTAADVARARGLDEVATMM